MIATAADRIGDVPFTELARIHGTPLVALDVRAVDETIRRFARAAGTHGIGIAYAGKALLPLALVRRLVPTPLALDVCSLGELVVAERGGMPAERIVLHGCGKTDDELAAAAAGRAGRIVVDHGAELDRLLALATPARPPRVLLRCNPGIEGATHAALRTSGDATKFGFSLRALPEAIARVRGTASLAFAGLHAHVGSQLFDDGLYLRTIDVLLDVLAREGVDAPADLIAGGGFGVDAHPGGRDLDVERLFAALAGHLEDGARARGLPPPRLGLEPGRAIVGAAGVSLYRVVAVKDHGERRFVIVDGGMADNPRPALYDAYHHPRAITGRAAGELVATTICGRTCENDELVTAPLPADLRPDDLVTLGTAGAYVVPMASNYNRFSRPPLVFVDGDRHHAVVRRETIDDLLRCEIEES